MEIDRLYTKRTIILYTTVGQRTFYYRGVSLWNSLDNSLKFCDCVRTLKVN